MRHGFGFDHPGAFQVAGLAVGKQPHPAAQQHRHQVDADLVQQPRPQVLLRDRGGADGDGALAGDGLGQLERALDPSATTVPPATARCGGLCVSRTNGTPRG